MPLLPGLWELGALLGVEVIEFIVLPLANEIIEKGLMRWCRTLLIMLNLIIPDVIVDKVLEGYARIITREEVYIIAIGLPDVFKSCLHAPRDRLLVLHIIQCVLRHVAPLHKATIDSRGLSLSVSTRLLRRVVLLFVVTAVV